MYFRLVKLKAARYRCILKLVRLEGFLYPRIDWLDHRLNFFIDLDGLKCILHATHVNEVTFTYPSESDTNSCLEILTVTYYLEKG